MKLRILSANDVRQALPMADAIEAMRGAFRALHDKEVSMPVRLALPTPAGIMLFMPAFNAGTGGLGQKVVSVFGKNPERGLPTIHALVTMYDATTGLPLALLEGTYLTALRTAAVTGLGTDVLARQDSRVLTIFGAGAAAATQIEAVCTVRPIEQVWIISRSDSAQKLAVQLQQADPTRTYQATTDREAATRAADVIITATSSFTPVFDGSWVEPGTHVNAVGSFRPDMQEIDSTLIKRAIVVVDEKEGALEEAGDLLVPMSKGEWEFGQLYAELSELVAGAVAIPQEEGQITYFKSCGLAIEDVAAGQAILRVAEEKGLGQIVEL